MRMRRKRNLDARLAAVDSYLIPTGELRLSTEERIWLTHPFADREDFSSDRSFGVQPELHPLDMKALFGNDNPLQMEIGCGKGQFAVQIAERNPFVNFIAVEMNQSVIVQACEKAKRKGLKNLRFLLIGAEKLPIFIEKGSVEHIYLNFSTPFPKKGQEKHRLTHECFLASYRHMLINGGLITQKTDNPGFFEFSLSSFSSAGFRLNSVSLDLHHSDIQGNIETEYEHKFASAGLPIYMLEAEKL